MGEQASGNGNHVKQSLSIREIHFPDGTTNFVWDRVGDTYDFNGGSSSVWGKIGQEPGLFEPGEVIGVRIDYDNAKKPYTTHIIFLDGGVSMVRIDTDHETKTPVAYYIDDDSALKTAEAFASAPMTIGSRPSRLAGGRLAQVMAMAPHTNSETSSQEAVSKMNPLSFAVALQQEQIRLRGR